MEKRRFNLVAVLLVLIAIILVFNLKTSFTGKATATAKVNNIAPNFSAAIPNQTWEAARTIALDLDNYFTDLNEQLFYNVTGNRSINITINQINGVANFSQALTFIGIEYVIFTGVDSDGPYVISNNVTLNVTGDIVPPLWSSPSQNKSSVLNNDRVLFLATWTDNFKLSHFTFSINLGSGFVNQSPVNFTGTSNTSSYEYVITGNVNQTVSWKFYAFDTSSNMNVTSAQSFNISSVPPAEAAVPGVEQPSPESKPAKAAQTLSSLLKLRQEKLKKPVFPIINFTIEPPLLKVELKQGESQSRGVKITNTGNQNLSLTFDLDDIKNFLEVSEPQLEIPVGEAKALLLDIAAPEGTIPDIYFGKVFVRHATGFTRILPVILQVNLLNATFDIDTEVVDYSKKIEAGELVLANISIDRLADVKSTEMNLEYTIKDLDGNTIDTNNEKLRITESIKIGRSLTTLEKTPVGDYIFYGRIVYKNESAISGDLFHIHKGFRIPAKIININLIILAIIILTLLISSAILKYQHLKQKARMLRLYFLISQAYRLIKEGKLDNAKIYLLKIKKLYDEKIEPEKLADNEFVKTEITRIYDQLTSNKIIQAEEKQKETKQEEKKEEPKLQQPVEQKQESELPMQQKEPIKTEAAPPQAKEEKQTNKGRHKKLKKESKRQIKKKK